MGEHETWFDLIPGYHALEQLLAPHLSRSWRWQVFQDTHFSLAHVAGTVVVMGFVLWGGLRFRAALATPEGRVLPPAGFGLRNFFEVFVESFYGLMQQVMGPELARKYLPLIGSLAFFIFFSNALGLIPGFLPPTSTLKTNLAIALFVFVFYHAVGIREHGLAYFKHFLGPIWWLAPLMLPIELISHVARPVSLSFRLMGNIVADHKVVFLFFTLVPILVPVPFLLLGVLVTVIQTLIFCILTMVYISMAAAHEEH
ncbi:MAG TPA: F0F1 ATP synthase subunit A [Polyangia bacterium]|nr:F0F1 ATP synthase subunit A [Polyangia bacterium]